MIAELIVGCLAVAGGPVPVSALVAPPRLLPADAVVGVTADAAQPRSRALAGPVRLSPRFGAPPTRNLPARSGLLQARQIAVASDPVAPGAASVRGDGALSRAAVPQEPDDWFAEDKLKHFLVSFAAATFAGAGARAAGASHGGSLVAGAAFGALAGVWKEAHDRATGGDVSARDLTWDGLGVAAATVVEAQTR